MTYYHFHCSGQIQRLLFNVTQKMFSLSLANFGDGRSIERYLGSDYCFLRYFIGSYEGDPKSKVSIMLGLQGNCSRDC